MTRPASRSAADWLSLAAAPAFAAMALLASTDGHATPPCSHAEGLGWGGMVPMYLLMAFFHLPPWLRLQASMRG